MSASLSDRSEQQQTSDEHNAVTRTYTFEGSGQPEHLQGSFYSTPTSEYRQIPVSSLENRIQSVGSNSASPFPGSSTPREPVGSNRVVYNTTNNVQQDLDSEEKISQLQFESELRAALSVSSTDISARENQTASITGLPSSNNLQKTVASSSSLEAIELEEVQTLPSGSQSASYRSTSEMGNTKTKVQEGTNPKSIMSENPQELLDGRRKVQLSEITGNCRSWSEQVYYKLFLDTEGRNATLMVLKCEISYVDVFTDEEHSLYKSRFIGGKADGVAQMFVFDLMKSNWEEKIPQSHAIELNVDIVMSSSPIHICSETILHLLQLEKQYLKYLHFDGQLHVMIRFAHAHGWDVKDDGIRERIHTGLRNLYREGVNLEVMSADVILEEMRVDGLLTSNGDVIRHYVAKRHAWRNQTAKAILSQGNLSEEGKHEEVGAGSSFGDKRKQEASTSSKNNSLATKTDSYYAYLHDSFWNIIQDTKRIQDILEETLDDI